MFLEGRTRQPGVVPREDLDQFLVLPVAGLRPFRLAPPVAAQQVHVRPELAVDTLPDRFRTTTNVTATMAGATVLARFVETPTAVTAG